MKCAVCNTRKAKRPCPALGRDGSICPLCCGEKRILELDCPETCEYLKAGREHESAEFGKRLRSQDPVQQEKSKRILAENQDVVAHLEYTIAQQRLTIRDLTDEDVSKAVNILLDDYRTEYKGILYKRNSDDLRVEPIRMELRDILEAYRNPEGEEEKGIVDPGRTRLLLQNAIECLEFLQFMIGAYSKDRRSASSYVDFLARMTPKREAASSIIMP
ncbi:MAG: hypothetical protein JXR49_00185 [Acidobacteria bacterium]|nr:hypothetical protein [Acidobacteriota bacterium]